MDKSVEWVLSELIPNVMPNIKAHIDAKNEIKETFELSESQSDEKICSIISSYQQKGIGLERIKDTGLHTSLAQSFQAMLSLGIDLKKLGK